MLVVIFGLAALLFILGVYSAYIYLFSSEEESLISPLLTQPPPTESPPLTEPPPPTQPPTEPPTESPAPDTVKSTFDGETVVIKNLKHEKFLEAHRGPMVICGHNEQWIVTRDNYNSGEWELEHVPDSNDEFYIKNVYSEDSRVDGKYLDAYPHLEPDPSNEAAVFLSSEKDNSKIWKIIPVDGEYDNLNGKKFYVYTVKDGDNFYLDMQNTMCEGGAVLRASTDHPSEYDHRKWIIDTI